MPDQNTHTVINVGDVLTADQIMTLPVGAIVTDKDGDTVERVDTQEWRRSDGFVLRSAPLDYFATKHKPYTLTSLPGGHDGWILPDLFQQARIALRDRTGTEPDIEHVHQVTRVMQDRGLTPAAAVSAWQLANVATLPDEMQPAARFGEPVLTTGHPAREQTYNLTHDLTVTVTTGDVVATVQLKEGAYPGTARKTLHSVIDRIADQIGALR